MKRTKCEECGGTITAKTVDYQYLGEDIGRYPAEVCRGCGEVVFDEAVSDQIMQAVKRKGLYGMRADTTVGVAGSSLVIRVNKELAAFLKLRKGQAVHLHPETKDRLIIELR